jgi:predicted AAA+ superfamily ATPase
MLTECSFLRNYEHMPSKLIKRRIESILRKTKKSVFLLGPRQVGKSTLIAAIKPDLTINLADEMELLRYSSKADEIRKIIALNHPSTVYVDEVQRLPKILNTIQTIIDGNKNIKFYLTGSSARKLKRGGANLLPGRVLNFNLGPLVASEFNYQMDTKRCLEIGTLPEVYLAGKSKETVRLLQSYAANYLKEEIKAEALTRNLESFARFLQECSLNIGQFIDYTKLSNRAKISRHACPRYFEILEDTMVGMRIFPLPLEEGIGDLVKHPKFFFFDNGIYNGLLGNFTASPDRIGALAEQLVYSQLLHSSWAAEKHLEVFSFRERSGFEVDFVVKIEGKSFGIEVKANDDIDLDDLDGLKYLTNIDSSTSGLFVFHMGTKEQKLGSIWSLPWQKGLQTLGF